MTDRTPARDHTTSPAGPPERPSLEGLEDKWSQEWTASGIYAFDRTPEMAADPDRKLVGVEEDEIVQRFAPQCTIIEIIRARPDRYPCRWYLLQRV